MAQDFRIELVADPKRAQASIKKVDKALGKTEKEALDLKVALTKALSARDQGVTASLNKINTTLERTEEQALITDARIGQIGKDISGSGIDRLNKKLKKTKDTASTLGPLLRRVFAGVGVVLLIRQVAKLSDEFTILQNKLRTIIPDQKELNDTFESLNAIANKTRTDVGSIVQLYQRGSLAAKELGASSADLLKFTERVGKALAVQGSSAAQSSGALLQLSQALGSGIVRAEEFNSILEGAFPIAQAAARGIDGFGGSVSKLRGAIIKGEITSTEFFRGFLKGSDETAVAFERTSSSIGQAFTVLNNNLTVAVGKLSETTGASKLAADAITGIGNNLVEVTIGVVALSTALLVSLAQNALPKATAAMVKFIIASGPLVAVAATFTALGLVITSVVKLLNALERVARQVEEDFAFIPILGEKIANAQREINAINREIAEQAAQGRNATDEQTSSIARLEASIAKARIQIRGQADDQRATNALAVKLRAILNKRDEATARQAALLEKLLKPQREFNQLQKDLGVLLAQNEISQAMFNAELAKARPQEEDAADPFAQQVQSLKELNDQLVIQTTNSGLIRDFKLAELELAREGRDLTVLERIELGLLLGVRQALTEELRRQKQEEKELVKIAKEAKAIDEKKEKRVETLKAQVDIIGQLKIQEQELLDIQREAGDVVIPGLEAAVESLQLRQLEASQEIGDGFTRAFAKLRMEAEDFASAAEGAVNSFADNATDALVSFVTTGRGNIKEFAEAFLDDIARILVRLLVLKAITAAAGLGGLDVAGLSGINSGKQGGGTVQPGQAPFPVGEAGEELFVPNRTGTIVPNAASVKQDPPQVNIQLVTVQSEDMVGDVIASGAVDDIIIQRIGANRDRVNQAQS